MLLPHEVVGTFLQEGETCRMTGKVTWPMFNSHPMYFPIDFDTWHVNCFYNIQLVFRDSPNLSNLRTLQHSGSSRKTPGGSNNIQCSQCPGYISMFSKNKINSHSLIPKRNHGNEDPQIKWDHVIPIRLFGDGAEAQSILVWENSDTSQISQIELNEELLNSNVKQCDVDQGNRNMRWSPSSSHAAPAQARWTTGYCWQVAFNTIHSQSAAVALSHCHCFTSQLALSCVIQGLQSSMPPIQNLKLGTRCWRLSNGASMHWVLWSYFEILFDRVDIEPMFVPLAIFEFCFGVHSDAWKFDTSGSGQYLYHDPWGKAFSMQYNPERFKVAGQPIGAPGWRGVLEGIQSDLDYLRLLFGLNRTASHQCFCHYCDSVQWVSNRSDVNHLNNVESLYTVYGPRESDTQKLEIISVVFF